jgi:hypothetical protein
MDIFLVSMEKVMDEVSSTGTFDDYSTLDWAISLCLAVLACHYQKIKETK